MIVSKRKLHGIIFENVKLVTNPILTLFTFLSALAEFWKEIRATAKGIYSGQQSLFLPQLLRGRAASLFSRHEIQEISKCIRFGVDILNRAKIVGIDQKISGNIHNWIIIKVPKARASCPVQFFCSRAIFTRGATCPHRVNRVKLFYKFWCPLVAR